MRSNGSAGENHAYSTYTPHPVFLSYARAASLAPARAVYDALGGADEDLAFLDVSDIEHGEGFDDRIIAELLGARVVVIFAEPVYFTRWYCLLEYRVARTPFLISLEPGSGLSREAVLAPLVLALPQSGIPAEVDRFPPLVQGENWPSVADPVAVARLVRRRLKGSLATIGELLEQAGAWGVLQELQQSLRLPPPLPIGRIPLVPPNIKPSIRDAFVGRADDLWRIDDLLVTRQGGAATTAALAAAIEGAGGIGKTRLALEYLHRFGPRRFSGGLFWIDAEVDAASLEARQHAILMALNPQAPPLSIYRKRNAQRTVAEDLLRTVQGLPAGRLPLFVVDNVPEPDPTHQRPEPLEHWCPVFGFAPVLVTSRSRISLGTPGTIASISVDVLDRLAAVALLTSGVSNRGAVDEAAWGEIAEWVGRLPLALELLNRLLRPRSISPEKLLGQARTRGTTEVLDEGMAAIAGSVPAGALRGISESLAISYDRLGPTEQEAARLLAWLAPDPIPEMLIEALGDEPFSAATRGVLITRSFVTDLTGESAGVFGSMHRVLADYLRTRSSNAVTDLHRVIDAIGNVMEEDRLNNIEERPKLDLCLPHAQLVLKRGEAMVAKIECFEKVAAKVALLLWSEGKFKESETIVRRVAQVLSETLGEEHPRTLMALFNLARNLWSQGALAEARPLYRQVLAGRRNVLGEEHPDTRLTMDALATILEDPADWKGAREVLAQLQQLRGNALWEEGGDVRVNNLAETIVFQKYREHWPSIRNDLERLLESQLPALRKEHPNNLPTMANLALPDLAGARQLLEQLLEIQRRLLGQEHPGTLRIRDRLAAMLRDHPEVATAGGT
jgi:tetratricopeptide (TPR) repeat protein